MVVSEQEDENEGEARTCPTKREWEPWGRLGKATDFPEPGAAAPRRK